ncbi:uncharacterized protein LOC134814042 isoform X2 [Bolinopsis microptera]|uniref:uncharacterized protein LOC134814042 isoform X2 n=1 Tax=Bolinopsis microptera TaxID=2820187 RepID=UPI003079CF6C
MLLDTFVCSNCKLSQIFPIDKGLIRHYVNGSETPFQHASKLSLGYQAVGSEYSITNKKLKDSLDEFEDLLEKYSVTRVTFITEENLQVLLNNGIIVYINLTNGNLSNIVIVRTLAKVLYGQIAFDGHVTPSYMILVCSGKLCLSTNAPDPAQFDKIFQHKIVNLEPDFCYVTHLSVANNMILLWTPEGNVIIYSPIGPGSTEVCRFTTPYRICAAQFNPATSTFLTCQLKPSSQGNVFHALSFTYDIVGKGKKARVLEVIKHRITHLRADVVCAKYNHACNKLLLGLSTGKVVLHCEQQKRNFTTEVATKHHLASFTWHSSDSFFVAVLKSGYIQVYDETLQIMSTSFGGFPDSQMVDINRIFNIIRSVSSVELQGNNIAVVMERGPLITMKVVMPNTEVGAAYFNKLLQVYFYRHQYKAASRLLRNCLHRFSSEDQLLSTIRDLVKHLVAAHFNESVFAVGAEVLLLLKKEKNVSEKGRLVLTKLALKFILKALHCKLYREALKLARKLDNEQIIGLVDQYVKFCGLSVTCKSPDQIKLSRKPTRINAEKSNDPVLSIT